MSQAAGSAPPRLVAHVVEAVEAGTIRHVVHLVGSVPDWRHVVLCPARRVGGGTDTRAHDELRSAGAEIVDLPLVRSAAAAANGVALAKAIRALRRLDPEVIHGHSSIGGVVARLAGRVLGRGVVYTPHAVLPSRASLLVERALARWTDLTIAVSPTERAQLERLRLHPRGTFAVVPNAIPTEEPPPLDLHRELGLDPGTPLVGSVCRLLPQKAPQVLVRAWREALEGTPAHAVLVGDGPLADDVDAIADGWDGYHRIPYLERAERAMRSLTIFTLTSRYEGAPYVLLEAMRAGVAIIATDVVGTHDTLAEDSGLLVPADASSSVAQAIRRLLADPDERGALAARGQARFLARFDLAMAGRRMSELYAQTARAR